MSEQGAQNTDREIYRGPDQGNGSYYSDSIFVTHGGGGIGINVDGLVIVKPLREWHRLAALAEDRPDSAGVGGPAVSIKPMALSDGRTDYFVSIRVGDREVTPHVFREEYKAAYHVALYDWLLNGSGEEPDVVEFGPDDWPAKPATPDTALKEAGEAVAWQFERRGSDPAGEYWSKFASDAPPVGSSGDLRNVRPLYAHPPRSSALPAGGSSGHGDGEVK